MMTREQIQERIENYKPEPWSPIEEENLWNLITLRTLYDRAEKAEIELKHWKGCNLYPHTYQEAVEKLHEAETERDALKGELEARTAGQVEAERIIEEQDRETITAKDELTEAVELIREMYAQASGQLYIPGEAKYSHDCISVYKDAQRWLIERGAIKQEECLYE